MGKVHCEACKKSCKGQAIRLQDTYFHIKCFKCKECKKQLASGGFYVKLGSYYCGEDYQNLFGTKCAACGKFVEGEVVTALGNTYHQTCFHCTRCNNVFGPGDKVTFTGKDYLCNPCLEETSVAATTPQTPSEVPATSPSEESQPKSEEGGGGGDNEIRPSMAKPTMSSTPARPMQTASAPNTLGSPISDMSDTYTDKENMSNGRPPIISADVRTSDYQSDGEDQSPRPHDQSRESRDSSIFDEFLNLPNKNRRGYRSPSHNQTLDSVADSVFDDNADTDRQDRLSPMQNMDSTLSSNSRHEVDYGKFYNTSYLQKPSGVQLRGPSINPKGESKSPHFHRPENFSYSQVRRDFIKPMRKETSSMMSALGETMATQKKKNLVDFMDEPMKNKEVIELAHFPDNTKHLESEGRVPPIEREDFPAPPATAAAYPELLYKYSTPGVRRTRGASSDIDSPDGAPVSAMDIDNEEEVQADPRLLKDIDHLSRLEKESGAAKVILEDLKRKAKEPPPPIDPVSSSRTPSASKEPMYKTRYQSHVFASPSRDLDYRSRIYSFDDQMIGKKYRSALQSVGNFPVERRTYELPKTRSNKFSAMKPGYTLRQPRTAHMPATFASARSNGYFSDIEQCVTRDSDFEDLDRRYDEQEKRANQWNNKSHELDRRSQELDRKTTENGRKSMEMDGPGHMTSSQETDRRSQKSQSLYTSQSSIDEYDPITGLRRGKIRGSSVSSDYSKSKSVPFKKVLSAYHTEEPPQIYPYDELKITNLSLPPGVDRNWIELHLAPDEFTHLFRMNREEFYRLAEWKRNDMKQRVLLF